MTVEHYRTVTSAIRQPILLVSASGEILVANPAAGALSGALAPGARLADALEQPEQVGASLRQWLRQGGRVPGRLRLRQDGGAVDLLVDVTRVQVEERPALLISVRQDQGPFAQLNDRLLRLQGEVSYRTALQQQRDAALRNEREARGRVERLHTLTAALAAALTVEDTVRVIRTHVPMAVGVDGVAVALAGDPLAAATVVGGRSEPAPDTSDGPFAEAAAQDSDLYFGTPDELVSRYPELSGSDIAQQPFLAAVVRMTTSEGKLLGLLGLRRHGRTGLSPEGRALARAVAVQCVQALERARLHDKDRRFAETLQRALLPRRLPHIEGLGVAVRYLPATERMAVGGDWYDVIELGQRRVALIVGDVAGHGQGAATAMAEMRGSLRALATAFPGPARVLRAFNQFVCHQLPDDMATVLYVVADLDAGTLRYAKAGHLPPLVVEGGTASYLREALGPPVGIAADTAYEEAQRALDAPWRIVAYTDGLVERRDEGIDIGLRRLARASVLAAPDAEALCEHVIASLVGGAELSDDAAVLVVTGGLAAAGSSSCSCGEDRGNALPPPSRLATRARGRGGQPQGPAGPTASRCRWVPTRASGSASSAAPNRHSSA